MAEKKTPRIRFEGFTEDWEQCKLGEITTSFSGGTPTVGIKSYYDGEIPFIRSAEINKEHTELFISENGLANSSARLVEKGCILYALYGATSGEVGISKIKGAINQAILAVIPVENNNSYFLMNWLRHEKADIISTYLQGGQGNLSGSIVKNLELKIPKCDEQYKIGEFFKNLDSSITLHQRKCEKLKMFKKSMLEKMFPKNGEKVPEVRFDGFTDDWEQCELEEYLYVSTRKNDDDFYSREDVLSVSGDLGIVNQIELKGRSYAGASVSNYGVVKHGDIVYTKSPLKSNPYGIIKTNKGPNGIVSTLYAVYEPKPQTTVGEFVQIYFEQDARVNNYLHPLVNKGAKNDMKVSDSNALKGKVIFPAYAEQKRISLFFSKLDKTITLHQRKVEKLQMIKKSMLDKMFV